MDELSNRTSCRRLGKITSNPWAPLLRKRYRMKTFRKDSNKKQRLFVTTPGGVLQNSFKCGPKLGTILLPCEQIIQKLVNMLTNGLHKFHLYIDVEPLGRKNKHLDLHSRLWFAIDHADIISSLGVCVHGANVPRRWLRECSFSTGIESVRRSRARTRNSSCRSSFLQSSYLAITLRE